MSQITSNSAPAYEMPIKADLNRQLSLIMQSADKKARVKCARLKTNFAARGLGLSTNLVSATIKALDEIHAQSIDEASPVIRQFVERMQVLPREITSWARPHLENLRNVLLAKLPAEAGHSEEHRRITIQYGEVFNQRLDSALRDIEIGFVKGTGFTGTPEKETWVTADEAVKLLKPVSGSPSSAQTTISERAHAGLIRARAQRLIIDRESRDNTDVPKEFWWAGAHKALEQDWTVGDFGTWIGLDKLTGNPRLGAAKVQAKAFSVTFARADIEKLLPPPQLPTPATEAPTPPAKGGRPKHDFWEDLLIAIAAQLYCGKLQPKTQAHIEQAMHQWIADHDQSAGETVVRERARKLWQAINEDGN